MVLKREDLIYEVCDLLRFFVDNLENYKKLEGLANIPFKKRWALQVWYSHRI